MADETDVTPDADALEPTDVVSEDTEPEATVEAAEPEPEQWEEEEPEEAPEPAGARTPWLAIVAILGAVLVLVVVGIWAVLHFGGNKTQTVSNETTETVEPASDATRGRGVPVEGWGEILTFKGNTAKRWDASNEAMSAKSYRGFRIPEGAIVDAFLAETMAGKADLFVYRTPRDLSGWWNTNWDHKVPKIFLDTFAKGDEFLVMELDTLLKHGIKLETRSTKLRS